MSQKSEFICKICNMVLYTPITLPCECVICGSHLRDGTAKYNWITCGACSTAFEIPKLGFESNKTLQRKLEDEMHLTSEEKQLKDSVDNLLSQLDQLQAEFRANLVKCELFCDAHFSELRRNIDLQREKLKSKIDEIALKMIDQTKAKEKSYRQKLAETMAKQNEANIARIEREIHTEFRKANIIVDEVHKLKLEQESQISFLRNLVIELDVLKSDTTQIQLKENPYGLLQLNNQRLVSCSDDLSIKIWDLETNECLKTLRGHTKCVNSLEVLDSNRFISGSLDQTMKV